MGALASNGEVSRGRCSDVVEPRLCRTTSVMALNGDRYAYRRGDRYLTWPYRTTRAYTNANPGLLSLARSPSSWSPLIWLLSSPRLPDSHRIDHRTYSARRCVVH